MARPSSFRILQQRIAKLKATLAEHFDRRRNHDSLETAARERGPVDLQQSGKTLNCD
jgi:hypothetical protein